jgi:hypothetical protein
MFSFMALVGLGLIRPKFDVRQSQIEGRFLGRRQSSVERWRRQSGLEEIDLADSAVDPSTVKPKRIVPLWTLASAANGFSVWLWIHALSRVAKKRELSINCRLFQQHGH